MAKRKKKRVDEDLKQDLTKKELDLLLRKAHLPLDYPEMTPKVQKQARMSVLQSWFDEDKPWLLCNNVKNYLAAHFLWVEFYYKPALCNKGVYFWPDPLFKYKMVDMVMSPSQDSEEASKALITATRRTGKTQSLIIELVPLICIVRPFTPCLISELNDRRTGEEMKKIKLQVEENERIHADFGAEGTLYPKRASGVWSAHHMKFCHHPGSEILGHSLGAAQRGRGPLFGCIDDPEDEENCYNVDWRKWFFAKIFDVYCHMFHRGGKIVWIGTPVHGGSCLSMAVKGMSEKEVEKSATQDKRFRDWKCGKFTLITIDKDGKYHSMQPERLSVAGFERKMETDPISARKEILCEPVTPGTRAFGVDPVKHGYMKCKGENGEEYFLDLYTGDKRPWKEFLDDLVILGAGDLADGQSTEADPGALVFIGINSSRVIYVLDVYLRRCFAEDLIEMAYNLAEGWECSMFGWEKAALQCVITRLASKHVDKLREEGKSPPVFREIENAKKNKVRRILTMIPFFGLNEIRFLQFKDLQAADGSYHYSMDNRHKHHHQEMMAQVVEFTDEGIRGHDDAIDALEMAIRLAGKKKGEGGGDPENMTDVMLERWKGVGVSFSPAQIPREVQSPKMKRALLERTEPQLMKPVLPYT